MSLVTRIVLDIVITRSFKFRNDMIRCHDVLAVNEEPRAVMHILFGKRNEDGEKDDTDKLFHDVTSLFVSKIYLIKYFLATP
jgi:hypothetical protein